MDVGPLIRDKAELTRLSDRLRGEGKRIVTINGCFDLLHGGHIFILNEAAAQGDFLIVGLNSDASVRANKGEGRPVLPENERADVLLSLEAVDAVCLYDEPDCIPFIEAARPHVHINDASYGEDCIEAPTVKALGGRLHLVEKHGVISTTNIIGRMRDED